MISPVDRQMAIDLIAEAVKAGARQFKACEVLEIDVRTLQRWKRMLAKKGTLADGRKQAAQLRVPGNKLSDAEREAIVAVCNTPEHQSLPPSQLVPRLADQGQYLASESTFYRVLHEYRQAARRGRAKSHHRPAKPAAYEATGPNQVWSWDSVP